MNKIIGITVVTAQGVAQHNVGENGICKISVERRNVSTNNSVVFFSCLDKDSVPIVEISSLCPIVINYENKP